jgi:hypothetical protein
MCFKNQSVRWTLLLVFALMGAQVSAQNGNAEDFDACAAPVGAEPPIYSDDGHWRMRSTGEAPCYTCTRTNITTAKRIAAMKARDGLLQARQVFQKGQEKFLEKRGCAEISGPDGDKQACQTASGFQTGSQAAWEGMLKGVVTIGECTDPEDKVVRVTVGVSSKTIDLADEIEDRSNSPAASRQGAGRQGAAKTGRSGEAPVSTDRPTDKKSRTTNRDF